MVPRVDIVTVSMSDNFNDIVNQLTKANHSRVPVTGETKDDIVGIIHIKDVLANINSKKNKKKNSAEQARTRHPPPRV